MHLPGYRRLSSTRSIFTECRRVCVAEKKVSLVRDVLVCSPYRHHLHVANVYCFTPLLDHLLRSSFPDDVIEPLKRFDAVIKSTAQLQYSERHLQRELTGEVEQWRQQQLQVRLDALHVHDRRRESFRAVKDSHARDA